ncbi:MAG TPA: hypothetical protein VI685_02395 [Candidatus Angelobacter sp.]
MAHITIAASNKAFQLLFKIIRDHFTFSKSDSGNFGPFSASYDVALHLEGGSLQLNDDNTIEVTDMDIVFDTLKAKVCFNLPGFCIPSFCIVPDPWNGCLVGFPGFCIGGPICAPIDLSGLVSEVSDVKAGLVAHYFVDPGRDPSWTDLDAELNGKSNLWKIFIDPTLVQVDPIDIPATVGNLLENAVKDAINNLLPGWLPGWAKDIIWAFLGPILDLIKGILNIVGEINEWLSNLLGTTFNLLGLIETAIADYFAAKNPIYSFEDPYPILDPTATLIPVKIPIRDLLATVNSKEMIVTANVGA